MQISDYVPNLYEKNLEMNNIINNEEIELENGLKPSIDNSFKDTFPIVATEKGISQYEKLLNINPNKDNESISVRRERIMARLINQIPYTERFLIDKLNEILGKNTWTYEMNYNNYTITINSLIPGRTWYNELLSFVDRIIPCNINVIINVYTATWNLVKDNFETWEDLYNTEMTWEDVLNAGWQN